MPGTIDIRQPTVARRFLGVLACLCFVLQQIVVPLHLALETHTWGEGSSDTRTATAGSSSTHEYRGGSHTHGDLPRSEGHRARRPADDGPALPHPAWDHAQEGAGKVVPPTPSSIGCLALLPSEPQPPPLDTPAPLQPAAPVPPERPPPKTTAEPRAPPTLP